MSDAQVPGKAELRAQMDTSLARFLEALDGLDDWQLEGPTDGVGWTVHDHLVHLAVWADGIAALLRREDRFRSMGLDISNPESDDLDYDGLNRAIREQRLGLSPAEARSWLVAAHRRVAAALDGLSDADLLLPYDRFVEPCTESTGHPVWGYVVGNTAEHYDEHLPWLLAIAAGEGA